MTVDEAIASVIESGGQMFMDKCKGCIVVMGDPLTDGQRAAIKANRDEVISRLRHAEDLSIRVIEAAM